MKAISVTVIFCLLIPVSIYSFRNIKSEEKDKSKSGFAVIELFTSEGCSSCPPADEAITQIQNSYADKNVLVLGYHVTYWDKLGWKDPFSSTDFTERQQYYAGVFNLNSIYTPQVVVNGTEEFVGSEKDKLIIETEKAIKENAEGSIQLNAKETGNGKIDITYSTTNKIRGDEQVVLLLVQKSASDKIMRGENEGKTLHHINIVRNIIYYTAAELERTTTLKLPTDLKKENLFTAAFVQNKTTGKISALTTSLIN
jgi:hypothetical protein